MTDLFQGGKGRNVPDMQNSHLAGPSGTPASARPVSSDRRLGPLCDAVAVGEVVSVFWAF